MSGLGAGFGFNKRRGGGVPLDPDVIAHIARVEADGGTVEDASFLNSFVLDAKANGYFADIVAAYSPSWGVKGTTNASDLYSITGVASDKAQTTGSRQPFIKLNDLNGRTRLSTDGFSTSIHTGPLAIAQPQTNVYMGVEQESWTSPDHLSSGINAGSGVVFQSGITPDLKMFSGVLSSADSNAPVGTPVSLRALFNGAASETQIDNNAAIVSDAGTDVTGGSYLFSDQLMEKNIAASLGAFVILDAAKDGSYAAKMTAIYNFAKAAYGTS